MFKGKLMLRTSVVFLLCFSASSRQILAVETKLATKAAAQTITLDSLIQKVVADGYYGELPDRIARSVNIPDNAPYRGVGVTSDQATDGMGRYFKVLLEKVSGSDEVKPLGLELDTAHRWPGNAEHYVFHASLDGKLENASFIGGKIDEQGKVVKGSGQCVEKDINSPEIKDRFKHELDLWLKKTCLKNEWRSAAIVDGMLQKKP